MATTPGKPAGQAPGGHLPDGHLPDDTFVPPDPEVIVEKRHNDYTLRHKASNRHTE